jgi:hypothetical protein
MDDKLTVAHCVESNSKTYHGDQWVTAEFLVLGDSLIQHYVNKELVLTYTKLKLVATVLPISTLKLKKMAKRLTSGFISLQSESHPIEFRKAALFDLAPYAKDKVKLGKIINKIKVE